MIRNATYTRSHRSRIGDATSALISGGIGAGVSLATSGIQMWMNSIQLSHDADSATTAIVNGLASQLGNLVTAYMAEPASCDAQRAALDAYDQAWQWLQSAQACGNPNYGAAGNRCISDRAPGGRYPWQTYYRDPIANDPRLANAGCDTSAQVLLPSLSTGVYQAAQIVSSPAASPSTSIPAAGVSATATIPGFTAGATVSTGLPNVVILGGLALLAFLLFSGGSKS